MYFISNDGGKSSVLMTAEEVEAAIKEGMITKKTQVNPAGDPQWHPIDTFFALPVSTSGRIMWAVVGIALIITALLFIQQALAASTRDEAIQKHSEMRKQIKSLECEVTTMERLNVYR